MEKEVLKPSAPAEELFPLERALFEVQRLVKPVKRDERNDFAGGSYASLEAVLDEIYPAFEKTNLVLMQLPEVSYARTKPTIKVKTKITHWPSGKSLQHELEIPIILGAKMNEIQSIGSAITYARRYSLLSILGMSTEDDDGSGGAGNTKAAANKPRAVAGQPAREFSPEEKKKKYLNNIMYLLTHQTHGLGKSAEEAQVFISDQFGGNKVKLDGLEENQLMQLYRTIKALVDGQKR